MKIPYAARFSSISFIGAVLYTWWQLLPGLPSESSTAARAAWLLQHGWQWQLGWWLWLVAIFSWMVLLVVLAWSYLPAHRVASMLQSGLMVIAAVLAIAGVTVWMALLPVVLASDNMAENITALVDRLAMGLLNGACFMGGAVTGWLIWDLRHQQLLSRAWLGVGGLASLVLLPLPFFALQPILINVSLASWLVWCLWLATRQRLPRPFTEWQ